MSKLAQLREQRNAKAKAAQTFNNQFAADQRMPRADIEKLDAMLAEVEAIDLEIEQYQRLAKMAGDDLNAEQEAQLRNDATRDPARHSDESRALRAYLSGGILALTENDRRVMMGRQSPDIRAAMSTTTNGEGGYTVATEYQRSLEAAMKAFGGMRAVATVIRTSTGAAMPFPTADATSEEGEIVGQNAAATAQDTTFGIVGLDVFRYSSKKIAIPFELLQDSFVDIEAYMRGLLAVRLARIQNRHFTVGDGIAQPRGIVVASSVGKVGAAGKTGTVAYDDLVDLEHSVDPAYRNAPGVGYMMHDTSLQVVRKIKDSNGRPIFVPGYESNTPGGEPDRLMGRTININQNMAPMTANAKSILFGQLSKYHIRDVMDLTLFRMTDSAFTLNGQVGFVAFQRSGGNHIDVGGAVKHYANSAT